MKSFALSTVRHSKRKTKRFVCLFILFFWMNYTFELLFMKCDGKISFSESHMIESEPDGEQGKKKDINSQTISTLFVDHFSQWINGYGRTWIHNIEPKRKGPTRKEIHFTYSVGQQMTCGWNHTNYIIIYYYIDGKLHGSNIRTSNETYKTYEGRNLVGMTLVQCFKHCIIRTKYASKQQ